MQLICPECYKIFKHKRPINSKIFKCKKCNTVFLVPKENMKQANIKNIKKKKLIYKKILSKRTKALKEIYT